MKHLLLCSVVAILLSGCASTTPPPKNSVNDWMQNYQEFSFDNFLNDYLSTNAVTEERVQWYINTNPELRKEYEARKESGAGFDRFMDKIRTKIASREPIREYKSFHRMKFYDYDKEPQHFNLLDRDGIGTLESFYSGHSSSTNSKTPGWFKVTAYTDIRGWKWQVSPDEALEIIENNPDRELYAYITYDLEKCESTQDNGKAERRGDSLGDEYAHTILCDLKAKDIRF